MLESGEDRELRCLEAGCWREERTECDGCLLTGCWRKERSDCDGVWERGTGERRGECVTLFRNRVLEIGEERV